MYYRWLNINWCNWELVLNNRNIFCSFLANIIWSFLVLWTPMPWILRPNPYLPPVINSQLLLKNPSVNFYNQIKIQHLTSKTLANLTKFTSKMKSTEKPKTRAKCSARTLQGIKTNTLLHSNRLLPYPGSHFAIQGFWKCSIAICWLHHSLNSIKFRLSKIPNSLAFKS